MSKCKRELIKATNTAVSPFDVQVSAVITRRKHLQVVLKHNETGHTKFMIAASTGSCSRGLKNHLAAAKRIAKELDSCGN